MRNNKTSKVFLDSDENKTSGMIDCRRQALFDVKALLRKQPAMQTWRAEHARQREWQGREPRGWTVLSMFEKQIISVQPEHRTTEEAAGEEVKAMKSL